MKQGRWVRNARLTERYGVSGYIPPQKMVNIAEERTSGLAAAFVALGARADHVGLFARSCYMQGVNDAIDSLHKSGLKIVNS